MISQDLGELLLDDLLVAWHCVHFSPYIFHFLAHRDLMLLGFIPGYIEPHYEVLNLILDGLRRTRIILLMRCGWWRWRWRLSRLLARIFFFILPHPKHGLISPKFFFIRGFIPYTSSGLGTLNLVFFTIIALIGCI